MSDDVLNEDPDGHSAEERRPDPAPEPREPAPAPAAPGFPPADDFLPPGFHAARGRAKVRAWRAGAASVAAALVAAGLLGGVWRTARLRAERDDAVAKAEALSQLDARAAALRAELAGVNDRAAVLAGLHLRGPASRLLADLAAAAEGGVTFTDVRLTRRPAPPAPGGRTARRLPRRRRRPDPRPPAAAGSARRSASAGPPRRTGAVAGLLSRAAAGGDFDAVELLFTDRGEEDPANAAGRVFSARLTARPAAAAD